MAKNHDGSRNTWCEQQSALNFGDGQNRLYAQDLKQAAAITLSLSFSGCQWWCLPRCDEPCLSRLLRKRCTLILHVLTALP